MEVTQIHYIGIGAILNFAGIMVVTWINIKSNKKHNAKTALTALLDEKVAKTVCDPAMKRIGTQIDEIKDDNKSKSQELTEQGKCLSGLEKGVSFIIGRMNGNYDNIKNTGLDLS